LAGCQPGSESQDGEDEPIGAWWYGIEFEPSSATVRDIEVHTIDEDWRRGTALDTSLLDGRVSANDIQQFTASPLSFSLLADLDGDGVSEEFFVGVFETVEGGKGRFVAVTRNGRVHEHFEEGGITGFSALLQVEGDVRWYKCMECGEFESIKWSGKSYTLE
jgi:hypothetical protein